MGLFSLHFPRVPNAKTPSRRLERERLLRRLDTQASVDWRATEPPSHSVRLASRRAPEPLNYHSVRLASSQAVEPPSH